MIFDQLIGPNRGITWAVRFWPVLLLSFFFALVATWFCKKIAIKFGIVDRPDDLVKTHKEPIAYLGGVGILIGLIVGVLAGISCLRNEEFFSPALKWLFGIMAGAIIACLVGLADDIFDLKPSQKILGQVAAAIALLAVGIVPNIRSIADFVGWPLPGNLEIILQALIVIVFVVGASNSLNLLDGLDGLCAGVTVIIAIAMLILSIHLATWEFSIVGDPVRIIICLGLLGGTFGFLPFNRYPAKIFMGDAGSMLLGFMIAALMILFAEHIPRWWLASIVVFGLPILDTAVALARRVLNRRPLFVSDRGHIYDQMIDRGIPLRKTVAISYVLASAYAIIGLVVGLTTKIRTWPYAVIVYILVFVLSVLVVWKKGYLKMKGLRGAVHNKDK